MAFICMFYRRFFYILLIVLVLFFAIEPLISSAITIDPPTKDKNIQEILEKIWHYLYMVALALVPLMAIVAAFMFLTAGGNPEKINEAKNVLLWLVIGVVVVLLAGGIVQLIKKILGFEE